MPADAWVALTLLLACAIFLTELMGTEGSGAFVKTTTLPTAIVIVLAILAVLLLIGAMIRPAAAPAEPGAASDSSEPVEGDDRPSIARVLFLLGSIAAYVAALPWFGYLLSSGLFLAGANLLYGNRNPVTILAAAIVAPIGLMLFFEKFMIILLPSARLFE